MLLTRRLHRLALVLTIGLLLQAQNTARSFTVVLDPAHGGADPGAQLAPDHAEKDFTLALARRLSAALRKEGITVIPLRDSDITLSADQRASETNTRHPDLYIALHGVPGPAPLRIYTAQLESTHAGASPRPEPVQKPSFLSWNSAQSGWLAESKTFASGIIVAASTQNESVELHAVKLRVLPSITAPAIAIETSEADDADRVAKIIVAAVLIQRGVQ
jgi:N-acetylmuramoyl-L-alanine amidase